MNELELTPWFVDGRPPVRSGVYEVSPRKGQSVTTLYAYFDAVGDGWGDGGWGPGRTTHAAALAEKDRGGIPNYYHFYGSWRGLARPPGARVAAQIVAGQP